MVCFVGSLAKSRVGLAAALLLLAMPAFSSARAHADQGFTSVGKQRSSSLDHHGRLCGECQIGTAPLDDFEFALESKEQPSDSRLPLVKISHLWSSGGPHVGRTEVCPGCSTGVWLTTFRWEQALCVTLCRFRI
jgi:hypothetical protein